MSTQLGFVCAPIIKINRLNNKIKDFKMDKKTYLEYRNKGASLDCMPVLHYYYVLKGGNLTDFRNFVEPFTMWLMQNPMRLPMACYVAFKGLDKEFNFKLD